MTPLGLDHLSVLGLPPAEFVALAAEAGYREVSLFSHRLADNPFGYPEWSLVEDAALRRETKARLDDLGVALALGEGCLILPDRDVADCEATVAAFAELGAHRLNLVSFEPDLARDFDQMSAFAELAGAHGLPVCVEFSARRGRPPLAAFIERLEAAGQGLTALIDAMHFFASGAEPSQLAEIDPMLLAHLQLCDARLDAIADYGHAAMHERLAPGEGALPLAALIEALPLGIPVSLELPQLGLAQSGVPHRDRLKRAADRARALLGGAR